MIIPAIVDGPLGSEHLLPQIGERGEWSLFWNAQFATHWAGLRPDWSLTATTHADDNQPPTHMAGEKHARIRTTAEANGVHIACVVYDVLPETITLTGVVRVTNMSESVWPSRRPETPTSATVVRMQLVSIVLDNRPSSNIDNPDPNRQWHSLQPIAGTEWFYELARPPGTLHIYRPPDGESGQLRTELLLLDLDTEI